ncbi:hypothetical protein K1719_046996 [Acacia pycnantha]|nr:hypothetical protein K1719_046996 [Acacia pycnantha]
MREVQALILSPTRELASHTEMVILTIGDNIKIQAHACIAGKSVGEDIPKLEYGVHVVSGTPGRVCDMIIRRTLRTRATKLLVLDESDEMLSRGFKDQIYDVVTGLKIETLGETSIPSTISYLDNAFVYIGRGSCVEVLERYVNLGPIVDLQCGRPRKARARAGCNLLWSFQAWFSSYCSEWNRNK